MDAVLRGLSYDGCKVYLDDLIAIACTFQEQLYSPQKEFQSLREAHLNMNPEKFQLFRKEVRYLSLTVSLSGVNTDPEKLEDVKNCPR
jgi:hypothetical protein